MSALRAFIDANRDRFVRELAGYLAIPSVSALPQHKDDVRRCAQWTAEALSRAGLRRVQVIATAGHPVVYGEWLEAPGAPTVLCYGHYDVQPADPLEQWVSPPFDASVRDGRIYARGATDDKGQLFMHVKAIEAHLTQRGRLPVNLKMMVEGEEEIGGPHLAAFVRDHRDLLAADVVVDSDSAMYGRGVPSLSYALRGIAYFQLDLLGAAADMHSGLFGGAVDNPAFALASLLAGLKGSDGRVTIPGFYDDVRPLTDRERTEFASLPFDEAAFRRELGVRELLGERGFTTLERVWARPSLDVHGLQAGFTGEGAKTVIPAAAMAKVSMRLVPDQSAATIADLFEAHVARATPRTMALTVTRLITGDPWMCDLDNPFVRAASRAMEHGFKRRPVFIREGGSNAVGPLFQAELGAPIVLFGIGLPTENAHAPNEHLDLENFHRGVIATARLYEEIGAIR